MRIKFLRIHQCSKMITILALRVVFAFPKKFSYRYFLHHFQSHLPFFMAIFGSLPRNLMVLSCWYIWCLNTKRLKVSFVYFSIDEYRKNNSSLIGMRMWVNTLKAFILKTEVYWIFYDVYVELIICSNLDQNNLPNCF